MLYSVWGIVYLFSGYAKCLSSNKRIDSTLSFLLSVYQESLRRRENGMAILEGAHSSYGALLFRPEWRAKRAEILQRDDFTCQFCGSTDKGSLQVHHRQYHYVARLDSFRLPWDYPNECLITVCEQCHHKGHHLYKVPTIQY